MDELRKNRRCLSVVLILSVVVGCGAFVCQGLALQQLNPQTTELGGEFTSETMQVNGITLHYVRGGRGSAVILIHGFPQDWFEYRAIMPRLAKHFTVIAVDLRGVGSSTATPGGYDAANMAEDIDQLVASLNLEPVYIVGHDIGGMVAYAFVRRFPRATRGTMILDVPLSRDCRVG